MNRLAQLRALAVALLPTLALGGGAIVVADALTRPAARSGTGAGEPRELQPQGDFTHPGAGFALPETVGEFRRVAVTQYDEGATNISAGYNRVAEGGAVLPIIATVYVYPVRGRGDIDEYFTKLLEEIGQHHGGAQPDFRQNASLCHGRFVGRYAAFGYEEPFFGVKLPLRSYLVLYRWKNWWVKWRVTTPAPRDGELVRAMVDLTQALVPPDDDGLPRRPAVGAPGSGSRGPSGN